MDELPDEFAVLLGRIVAGRTDTFLGKLVPPKDSKPGARGLSGQQLQKALAPVAAADPALRQVLAGYGELYSWVCPEFG